ncbi:thioredoxin H-type 1-like [Aristolochia californica]|uniref:thioredoxin H-type 1-like n=1 Tax=Aristolochia californica TaxID=171875 RepID=UPI0035E10E89
MATSEGTVIACHRLDDWTKNFQEGADSKKLVVVDFTASWCGPCKFITPILVELAKKLHDVNFLKVDVDELKEVAAEWTVDAMPTFIFLKEGKEIDRLVGARKEELLKKIETYRVPLATA